MRLQFSDEDKRRCLECFYSWYEQGFNPECSLYDTQVEFRVLRLGERCKFREGIDENTENFVLCGEHLYEGLADITEKIMENPAVER